MDHVFVSGNAALDLAGTLKWRRSTLEEGLTASSDLDDWLAASGVADELAAATSHELDDAKMLREAIYQVATAAITGDGSSEEDLATINRFASLPPLVPVLSAEGVTIVGPVSAALSTVARAAAGALAAAQQGTLKECGRDECTRLFIDHSRGNRRSWCGMDECGNRVNAAAYRRRRRSVKAAS